MVLHLDKDGMISRNDLLLNGEQLLEFQNEPLELAEDVTFGTLLHCVKRHLSLWVEMLDTDASILQSWIKIARLDSPPVVNDSMLTEYTLEFSECHYPKKIVHVWIGFTTDLAGERHAGSQFDPNRALLVPLSVAKVSVIWDVPGKLQTGLRDCPALTLRDFALLTYRAFCPGKGNEAVPRIGRFGSVAVVQSQPVKVEQKIQTIPTETLSFEELFDCETAVSC